MARWLALCPRPIKRDQCLRPQTRKLPVKKFLHSANISRGSLMRYGLKLMKFDDRQRLSPEQTGLLITPAVRARGCSLYFVFVFFCFDSLMRRRHAWKAVSRWSRTSLTGTSAPTRHPGACFSFEQQILRRYDSTHCLWRYILPLFRNFS